MSTVQSIERAFAILNALAASGDGLGVTALARQLGLPKSTVSRLLGTLEGLSAVERYPTRERFRIGGGVLALVLQVPFYQRLATLARPFLQNLAEQLGEDVALCDEWSRAPPLTHSAVFQGHSLRGLLAAGDHMPHSSGGRHPVAGVGVLGVIQEAVGSQRLHQGRHRLQGIHRRHHVSGLRACCGRACT